MAGDKAAVARAEEEVQHLEFSDVPDSLQRSSSVSTPRVSSAATSLKSTPRKGASRAATAPAGKYVSAMAKAREERKRREASASAASETSSAKCGSETSGSTPPTSGSELSGASPAVKSANLPKFGEWEKHSANSGPCYTLLFQHASQEKKSGGPVPVRKGDSSPPRAQDLYNAPPPSDCKSLKRKQFTFLCCF